MRRPLLMLLAVASLLSLAAEAGAKVMLEEAEACGASGCRTQAALLNRELPFELLGPTIEAGRRAEAPVSLEGPRYRVALTTQPVPGRDRVSLDYLPDAGYIRVLGRRRSEAGGALLNTGWVRLGPREQRAYESLTDGLAPFDAPTQSSPTEDDGGIRGMIPSVVAAALGVLVLLLVLARVR